MKTRFILFILIFPNYIFAQNPGGISSNLKAWYKADGNVSTSSHVVSSWNNEVAGGINISNVSGTPDTTAAGLNFNPTIKFDGSSYMSSNVVTGSNFISASNNSMFIVFTSALPAATAGVMSKWENITANRTSWEITSSGKLRFDYPKSGLVGDATINGTKNSNSSVNTFSYIGTGSTNGTVDTLNINGLTEKTQASTITDTSKTGRLQLGANWAGGSFPFIGQISEIIYYDAHLVSNDRRRVESYLAIKYGITLGNTTTPISYLASDLTTVPWAGSNIYQNNVAGIGRDDNASLNQKQSKSVNPNSLVTMGLTSIAASNAANTNSFAANKSFLVWGDNNQALSSNGVTDLPSGIQSRIACIWRSQETGTVGTVRLKFDLSPSQLASFGIDYQYLRLLVDGDGVFASGATSITPVAYNNSANTIEFNVDFTAGTGFYFSLGSTNKINAPLPLSFVSFSINHQDKDVSLHWVTTNEKNVKNFIIQWSPDGIYWIEEGSVAANNSMHINYYTYTDDKPHSGTNYYRLKEVDFDGQFAYSLVQSINKTKQLNIHIEPIPAQEYIYVSSDSEVSFMIIDNNGQLVYQNKLAENESKQIDVVNWANGIYFVEYFIESSPGNTQKIIISH